MRLKVCDHNKTNWAFPLLGPVPPFLPPRLLKINIPHPPPPPPPHTPSSSSAALIRCLQEPEPPSSVADNPDLEELSSSIIPLSPSPPPPTAAKALPSSSSIAPVLCLQELEPPSSVVNDPDLDELSSSIIPLSPSQVEAEVEVATSNLEEQQPTKTDVDKKKPGKGRPWIVTAITEVSDFSEDEENSKKTVPSNSYTCKYCQKSYKRFIEYQQHVDSKTCAFKGHFCQFCSKQFANLTQKRRHETRHEKIIEKREQIGRGFVKTKTIHGCSVFEERFNMGEILSIEQAFRLKRDDLKAILKQQLRQHKIIRFGTVVTGRFEIPDDNGDENQEEGIFEKEMEMPMRSPYRILFLGDEEEIDLRLDACLRDTLQRLEDLELRGSGWSLCDILSFVMEVGKCSLIGSCDGFPKNLKSLAGSEYLRSPPSSGERCFLSAIAQHFLPDGCTEKDIEKWAKTNLNLEGAKFPMNVKKLRQFEAKNTHLGLKINVFLRQGGKCFPAYRSEVLSREAINLLLVPFDLTNELKYDKKESGEILSDDSDSENENGVVKKKKKKLDDFSLLDQQLHYCYITDLDKFLSHYYTHSNTRRRYGSLHCVNCLANFTTKESLAEHQLLCFKMQTQKVQLSKTDTLAFSDWQNKDGYPILGFFDFESALVPTPRESHPTCQNCQNLGSPKDCKHATFEQNEQVPICYSLVFINREREILFQRTESSSNVMPLFFKALEDATKLLVPKTQKYQYKMFWTDEDDLKYRQATTCHYCGETFKEKGPRKKVRDHSHIDGKGIGAAHQNCNLRNKAKEGLLLYCHNLSGYDSHFIIKHYDTTNCSEFSAIPTNTERFKTFEINQVKFVDSMAFFDASLAELVDDLVAGDCQFKILENSGIYKTAEQRSTLIKSKGIFPYEYIKSYNVLKEKGLPSIENFYSSLREKSVSPEDYNQAVKTYNLMGCETLEDYCQLYCRLDTLQLAEAMLAFIEEVQIDFGLDASNYISLPQLAWQCMLKHTGVVLDYLPNMDMINIFEQNIRGGVSFVNVRMVDTQTEGGHLMYLDFTNLYGYAQQQKLPIRDYEWLTQEEIENFDILAVDGDSEFGYGLEVDLVYPEHLHHLHNDLPLAPETTHIFYDDLSTYSKECLKVSHKGNPLRYKSQKLCGNFKDKKRYFTHIKNLKFYVEHGLKVTKIHRIIKFQQVAFAKDFIDFCAYKRKISKSNFKSRVAKLVANATYGRYIMNVRNHSEVRLLTRSTTIEKYMGNPRFQSYRILNNNLIAMFLKKKTITLDKHWSVGWTILELSKLAMFELYYEVILPRFGRDKVDIVMSDTDSFIFHIRGHTLEKINQNMMDVMDFSNYPKDSQYYSRDRAKIPGFVKNEVPDAIITEIVAPKSKCYAYKTKTKIGLENEEKKCKGVTKARVKRMKFESYKKCITDITAIKATSSRIAVKNHRISTVKQLRLCLSSFDDKRYLLSCGKHSVPHKNENEKQNETCQRCSTKK